jgi:hypothetical protein
MASCGFWLLARGLLVFQDRQYDPRDSSNVVRESVCIRTSVVLSNSAGESLVQHFCAKQHYYYAEYEA